MCPPLAAVMPMLTAGSAMMSYVGGQQNLSAQTSAANSSLQQQLDQNQVRQTQINAQATDQQSQGARAAEVAMGRISAVSGESGVQLNGDAVARDEQMASGMDSATIEANRKAGIVQSNNDANTYKAQAQSRINEAYSKAPSLLGTGLQIAGAGMTYYNSTIPTKAG